MRKLYEAACRWIFFKCMGWKAVVKVPDYNKCILCVAPHTSNWDFIIAQFFYGAIGRKASFLMKKEWFIFPLNLMWRTFGGIPVDRSKKTSLVDQIIERVEESDFFHLAITPEATRKYNPEWKRGFYYIALGANIPIVLYGVDYPTKTIIGEKVIYPTGDVERDMDEIRHYYQKFDGKGKHPEKFTVGEFGNE